MCRPFFSSLSPQRTFTYRGVFPGAPSTRKSPASFSVCVGVFFPRYTRQSAGEDAEKRDVESHATLWSLASGKFWPAFSAGRRSGSLKGAVRGRLLLGGRVKCKRRRRDDRVHLYTNSLWRAPGSLSSSRAGHVTKTAHSLFMKRLFEAFQVAAASSVSHS